MPELEYQIMNAKNTVNAQLQFGIDLTALAALDDRRLAILEKLVGTAATQADLLTAVNDTQAASKQAASKQAASKQTASKQTASKQTASKQAASKQTASKQAVSLPYEAGSMPSLKNVSDALPREQGKCHGLKYPTKRDYLAGKQLVISRCKNSENCGTAQHAENSVAERHAEKVDNDKRWSAEDA